MDLISREAAIEACIEVSKQEEEHSKMWAAGLRYSKRILTEVPTVPAVPLDKLCEWLAGYAEPPLDALTICDNPFEAWKMTLTKWMEEQDAAD